MNYIQSKAPWFSGKKLALVLAIFSSILALSAPAHAYPVEYVGKKPESIQVVTDCDPPSDDLKMVEAKTFNAVGTRLSDSKVRKFLPFADSGQLFIPISYADFGSIHFAREKETIIRRLAQNRDGSFCSVYIVMRGSVSNSNEIRPLSETNLADPIIQSAIVKMTKNGVRICKYRHKVNAEVFARESYEPFKGTQLRFCELVGRFGDEVFPEAVKMGITLARLSTDTESYIFLADDNMAIFIKLGGK